MVEFLLLTQKENNVWECLCKPGKRAKVGTRFNFGEGKLYGTVIEIQEDGNRLVQFDCRGIFMRCWTRSVKAAAAVY